MVKRGVCLYLDDELVRLAKSKNIILSPLINQFLKIELLNEFKNNENNFIESLKHTCSQLATELDQKNKEIELTKKEIELLKEKAKTKKPKYLDLGVGI